MDKHTLLTIVGVLMLASVGAPLPSGDQLAPMEFQHWAILDQLGHFHMFWTPGKKDIMFEIQVATRGYVGLGFSPNGGMKGADILLGWVDDQGTVHAHDRYAVGMMTPLIDDSQDVEVIGGYENDTHTVLRFSRPWNSCDKDHDFELSGDTTRVIWAYSDEDPMTEYVMKKHTHRGTKSIFLQEPQFSLSQFGDDVRTWEVKMNNVSVPGDVHTVYWCQLFKVPPLKSKTHVIGVEPIIEEKNREHVHHMLLYECHLEDSEKHYEKFLQVGGVQCSTPNMPLSWNRCRSPLVGWAVGGEGEVFPDHVGLPIGEEHGGATYFMMEMHYDNPNYRQGIVDSSGLRVFLTENLREFDAGILILGHTVSPTHVIPPGQEWKTVTYCPSDCMRQSVPEEGIKVFRGVLHAHLLGRDITVRQIRQGRELPIVFKDMNYDFNYQQSRYPKEEMVILPGDSFITECGYDSTKKRDPTFGGESTQEEMCVAFFTYYPRVDINWCLSTPEFPHIYNSLGVQEVYNEGYIMRQDKIKGQIDVDHENKLLEEMKERERNNEKVKGVDLDTGKAYKGFVTKSPSDLLNTTVYDILHDPATWKDNHIVATLQSQVASGPQQIYCGKRGNNLYEGFPRRYNYPDFVAINKLDEACDVTHESEVYLPEDNKAPEGVNTRRPDKTGGASSILLSAPLITLLLSLFGIYLS